MGLVKTIFPLLSRSIKSPSYSCIIIMSANYKLPTYGMCCVFANFSFDEGPDSPPIMGKMILMTAKLSILITRDVYRCTKCTDACSKYCFG